MGVAGSSSQSGGTFTVSGSGADIFGTADAFQFDYQSLTGDGSITARVVTQTNTNPWAKAGLMFRQSLTASSAQALVDITPSHGVVFSRRISTGGLSTTTYGPIVTVPYWLRLVRAGNTFTAYASPDGQAWTLIGEDSISMAGTVYVGLAVTSHYNAVLSTATFDNVSVHASAWNNQDIGAVAVAGSSSQSGTTYTVSGSGADIFGTADAFQFDYQPLTGDGSITARVVTQTNTNPWAKAGLMIRETLSASSTQALVDISPSHGVVFQRRVTTGGLSTTTYGPIVVVPYWLRLTRAGSTFTAYASPDGKTWTQIGQDSISMATTVYIGLAVTSHYNAVLSTATFDNLSFALPAPPAPGLTGNQDVGTVGVAGSSSQSGNTFTVSGSGGGIGGTADAFQFDYESLSGNATITVRVDSQSDTNASAEAGVMIREALSAGSTQAFVGVTPSDGVVFLDRSVTGGTSTSTPGAFMSAPYWLRLTRTGNTFSAYASPDGQTWTLVGQSTISMASTVYVGLAVTSHSNSALSTATFDNLTVGPTLVCSPLNFGAVGDGTTDNTSAIQNAVNQCAGQGGGIVELGVSGNSTYLTGPFTLKSHVYLQLDKGVLLQATHTHSRYVAAYIKWVYQPNEALISAQGATDVAIVGSGIIDGAGNQPDPSDGGRTWYQVAAGETLPTNPSLRPWMLEFYQCDHVTLTGVTLRNSPYWNQAFRFSSNITESGATIFAEEGPNTDGLDLVGATNATLSGLNISVIDDDIAIKSGLPISTSDPFYSKEIGLPQLPTSNVQITNITATNGAGIAIGSEAVNGVNNVTIDGVKLTNTSIGFRIKSARDRGGPIYGISVNHLTMNVTDFSYPRRPLVIDSWYTGGEPDPWGAAQPLTRTTPYIHDITVQNFVATNANAQSYIQGLPESCIRNVTLSAVSIQATSGLGIDLHHMTGTFTNVASTPSPPFVVDQNVSVTTAGTTPAIVNTPPGTGQIACSAQGVPP